jgi:hypothetical protein
MPQLQVSPKRSPSFTPLSTEHCHVDQPRRPFPEAAFAAMTFARAHRRSTTSEPVLSTTPLACCQCGAPLTREILLALTP